jgi:hypothetical protein
MSDYRKLAEEALKKAKRIQNISEGVSYPDGITERMHPTLEKELKLQKHSLGKHPAFPESDECSFEEKILGERFADVVRRYKRSFDTDQINEREAMTGMMGLVHNTMEIENKHRRELEKLAVQMIREEYDMDEDVVEIHAELSTDINMDGTQLNESPITSEIEFDSHDQIVEANEEVYKRRMLNALTQGAAKKCNQMFHMVDDELTAIDPRLPNMYSKMMAAADYMYYKIPRMEKGVNGGVVRVEFPSKKNPKAVIYAQAMVFPVLIHELVKGVMELLSAHGLPKDKKIAEYVINKADFLAAEPWDMRLGPALWEKFTHNIEADDFKLKHHIFSELAALPVREFNRQLKEIFAGTKAGKKIILDITNRVKQEMQEDEFNEAMGGIDEGDEGGDEGYSWEEIEKLL